MSDKDRAWIKNENVNERYGLVSIVRARQEQRVNPTDLMRE